MSAADVNHTQRHTRQHPCRICGGHAAYPQGKGVRCAGFLSADGLYEHCQREQLAGSLPLDERTTPPTYAHRLDGPCNCGVTHGPYKAEPDWTLKTTPTARYDYHDANGKRIYQAWRFERTVHGEREKTFRPAYQDTSGKWRRGNGGIPRVLYRLPQLLTADPALPVYITEGEKDADRLAALGLIATTNALGAGSWDSVRDARERLRGRHVVILEDNDQAGRDRTQILIKSLRGVTASIGLVRFTDMPEHSDVSDWLDEGHSADELRALINDVISCEETREEAPKPSYRATRLSDVQPETMQFLWLPYIPRGKLTTMDGDPGDGKSMLTMDLAARWTSGSEMPDGSDGVKGAVIILSAEDGLADTIRPRLDAAGADCSQVYALTASIQTTTDADGVETEIERDIMLPGDLPKLEALIKDVGAVAVIVDPIMAYLDPDVNSHRDQDARLALRQFASLAERTNAAFIVVRHLNKSNGGKALYRGGGSIAFIGAARSGLLVARDPDDQERRILHSMKLNAKKKPPSLAFRIAEDEHSRPHISWEGPVDITAEELLSVPGDAGGKSALDEAVSFLRDMLGDGDRECKIVKNAARDADIAEITLKRARTKLGVKHYKSGQPGRDEKHWWHLPDVDHPSPDVDQKTSDDPDRKKPHHKGANHADSPEVDHSGMDDTDRGSNDPHRGDHDTFVEEYDHDTYIRDRDALTAWLEAHHWPELYNDYGMFMPHSETAWRNYLKTAYPSAIHRLLEYVSHSPESDSNSESQNGMNTVNGVNAGTAVNASDQAASAFTESVAVHAVHDNIGEVRVSDCPVNEWGR